MGATADGLLTETKGEAGSALVARDVLGASGGSVAAEAAAIAKRITPHWKTDRIETRRSVDYSGAYVAFVGRTIARM